MPASPSPREREPRWPEQLTAWERATNTPLFLLALLFLIAYAVPILYDDMPSWGGDVATLINFAVWVLYGADYAWRLVLAGRGNRIRFVYTHPLDLIMVLVPLARPLRVVRMMLVLVEAFGRHARTSLRTKASVYIVGITAMILLVSSLAVLDAEQGRDAAQITTFGDALWWSVVTASTVGYGDLVPQTAAGHVIAAMLMFAGIGLVGLVSGSLASWFVDRVGIRGEEAGRAEAADLSERLAALEAQVAEIHAAVVERDPDAVEVPDQRS
ncbi:potassium channel family protein [Glycomyces arizonensis]|uniref:potassium channel family protein n=1 Tax=Glycomyces arizonensis TaxID=256035 RepID=UPI00041801AD|nr:potassium channel family protein [Glycomyces arizonensis]